MLYIQSVHPSNAGSRSVAKINAYNAAVDAMITEERAAGNDNVEYLPVPGMDGIISDGGMSYDRLHMTGKGYSVWTHAIAGKVGVTATLPPADASWTQVSANLGGSNGMRAAQFSVLPVTAEDVLVVGGEVVHGGEWHELFGNANVKSRGAIWGAGDYTLSQHKTQMEQCILGNLKGNQTSPKAVVLYIGQSDNGSTTFEADYKAVVDAVFTRSAAIGGTAPKVYCVSLLPIFGTNRTAANTAIQAVCNSSDYNGDTGKSVTYVDIASGMTDNATTITADYRYPNNSYISGIGYAKMAELMAAAIPEVAPTAGRTAITEAEARANIALFNARKQLGNAIESNRSGMITASEEGIASAIATLDGMTYGSADPAATATAAIEALNATRTSHFDADKWYAIKMPDAARLCYVAVNHGNALSGNQTPYTHDAWWKIIAREDGTFDIKDYDGRYIVPDNFVEYDSFKHLTVSETAPATGWSISRTGDKYIITNGTVQMHVNHQNPPKYHVMNYGGGTNTSDTGCLFAFEEIDEAQNVPTFLEATSALTQVTGASPVIETGWYVVRNVTDGAGQVGVGAGFDVLYSRATALTHNNQPYYLGFDHAEGFRPDMLVRFEKVNDTSFKIRLMNGGVVSSAFELTGTEGNISLALADADKNTYKLGGSWPFWKESNGSLGLILGYTGSDGNRATSLVYNADSKAAEYDWYQVAVNGTAPDGFSITYNGTDCLTQATVNNGGFYFFTKDTQIDPLQFTCTANAEGKLPTVSVDAAGKTITADYDNVIVSPEDDFEARKITTVASLTSGWYQVKLVAGNDNIAENSRYIVNANNEQTHTNGQYALKLGTLNMGKLPTSFVRFTASAPSGTSVNVAPQGLNGHYVQSDARATYDLGSDLTAVAEVSDGFTIGTYWMDFSHSLANINGGAMENPMVGKGSSASGYHWVIAPVTDLTPYKIYQISIVGGEKPASLIATRVAMSGAENKGIEKVFDGGYFFVDKDAEVSASSFTPDAIEGKVTTITIGTADAEGIIPVTVTYAEKPANIQTRDEIVDGAWYTVKLVTAHDSANQTELEGKSVVPTTNPWIYRGNRTFEMVFADYPEATPAKAYIKMTRGEGNLMAMQLSNGHNLDKTESFASNVAKSFDVTGEAGVFNFGGTAEYKNEGQWFMSNSSNGAARYAIFPVSESELASMKVYRVSIEGGLTAGAPSAYSYVVPDAAINKGAERVYDGGYVFVANDAEVDAATFAASEVADKVATVVIGEAGEDGVIPVTVTYAVPLSIADYDAHKIVHKADIAEGWYVMRVESFNNSDALALDKYVTNTENEFKQNGTNYYGLKYADLDDEHIARAFVYLTAQGANIRTATGRNVTYQGLSMRDAQNVTLTDKNDGFQIGDWHIYSPVGYAENPLVGGGKNAAPNNHFSVMSLTGTTELEALKIYQVSIVGGNKPADMTQETRVALNSEANRGTAKVFDGGYFFVDKDAEMTEASFTPDEIAGKVAVVEIGEAGEDGITPVTVTYKNVRTVSITAPAEDAHYTLKVTDADGTEIADGTKMVEGSELTVTVTPENGYAITEAAGMTAAEDGSYTMTVTVGAENVTIAPAVTAKQLFTISWEEGDDVHYTVSVTNGDAAVTNGAAVVDGTELSVELTPDEGYIISEAKRNDTPITASNGTFNDTFAIAENVTITATTKKLYAVTWNVAEDANYTVSVTNGDADVTNGESVAEGTDLTVTFTAAEGYHIERLGDTDYEGFGTKTATATITVGEAMAFPAITVAPDIVEPAVAIDAPTTEGVESTLGEGEKKEDKPVFYEAPTTEVAYATITFHHNSKIESVELPATVTDAVGKGEGEFMVLHEDESIATGELDCENAKLIITRNSKVGQTMLTIVWRPAPVSRAAAEEGDIELAKVLVKVITPGASAPVLTNNSGAVTLYLTQSMTPMIAVEPEGLTNALHYESTNPEVASVDPSTGLITAFSEGSCEILVTMEGFDGVLLRIPVVAKNATGNPGEGVTGIDAVNADAAEGRAEIYDLAGRRIKRVNTAGIYIVNGVKTLVR